jgi:hypothetical protein
MSAYSDLNINNQFVVDRKRGIVMGLKLDAYKVAQARINQQLFYMQNEEHRKYLQMFMNSKFWTENTTRESRRLIIEMFGSLFNRGLTKPKAELRKNKWYVKFQKVMNIQRVAALSDFFGGVKQLSSVVKAAQTMQGSTARRFRDIAWAVKEVTANSQKVNEFLDKNMIEVYARGLSDYDLGGASEPMTMKRILEGINTGDYERERSYVGHLFKTYGSLKGFSDIQLFTLILFDRVAAKITALSNYKNAVEEMGVEVDLDKPNAKAVDTALQAVRETQGTDNPLFKQGVLLNVKTNRDAFGLGDGAIGELLNQSIWSFKSFAMTEKTRIRQSLMEAYNGGLKERKNFVRELAYDYAAKVTFHAMKGAMYYYTWALMAAWFAGGDDEEVREKNKRLDWVSYFTRSTLDYFLVDALQSVAGKAGLAIEETIEGESLTDNREQRDRSNNRWGTYWNSLGLIGGIQTGYARDSYELFKDAGKVSPFERNVQFAIWGIETSYLLGAPIPTTPEMLKILRISQSRLERDTRTGTVADGFKTVFDKNDIMRKLGDE